MVKRRLLLAVVTINHLEDPDARLGLVLGDVVVPDACGLVVGGGEDEVLGHQQPGLVYERLLMMKRLREFRVILVDL